MNGTGERDLAWDSQSPAGSPGNWEGTSASIPPWGGGAASPWRFPLPLPAAAPTAPAGATSQPAPGHTPLPQPSSPLEAKTLLLIEDDVASAQPLCILLRRQGWQVHAVTTISQASLYLDTHAPASIILDLMLPDGEGSVILDRVRRSGMPTKVTVTTASTDPDRLNRVRGLRPDALLTKPLDLAELLRVI